MLPTSFPRPHRRGPIEAALRQRGDTIRPVALLRVAFFLSTAPRRGLIDRYSAGDIVPGQVARPKLAP